MVQAEIRGAYANVKSFESKVKAFEASVLPCRLFQVTHGIPVSLFELCLRHPLSSLIFLCSAPLPIRAKIWTAAIDRLNETNLGV